MLLIDITDFEQVKKNQLMSVVIVISITHYRNKRQCFTAIKTEEKRKLVCQSLNRKLHMTIEERKKRIFVGRNKRT